MRINKTLDHIKKKNGEVSIERAGNNCFTVVSRKIRNTKARRALHISDSHKRELGEQVYLVIGRVIY